MSAIHKQLTSGRWNKMSFFEQMANVGSEVERTINWQKKNQKFATAAFDRTLELMDLTISDNKNIFRLKELCRLREVLVDFLWGKNEYRSTEKNTKNYFYIFNYACRAHL